MNTYFTLLWRTDRRMFFLALLFAAGLLLPTLLHFEVTPFYDWKMYAFPAARHQEYDVYQVSYDGHLYNRPHTWQDYDRMMVNYTLPHFDVMRRTGDTLPFYTKTSYLFLAAFKWNPQDNRLHTTPADLQQYPAWLKRYLQQQVGQPIRRLEVSRIAVQYDKRQRVYPVARQIVIQP